MDLYYGCTTSCGDNSVPASAATGVPVGQVLSATFSLAMNPGTISATTFTVTGPGGTAVAGTVTYSGVTATFAPTAALAYGALYTATITTGATSLAGTPLAANYVWTFTTITPPPLVVSTVSANGATGVPISQVLSATFNEAMSCATLTSPAATFVVTGPGLAAVAGTASCTGAVVTFTPSNGLAVNTIYTATINTGAKSLAGNSLAANYVWTFRTVPAPTPPTVISTVPENGATGVPINQALTATFSEAMTPATISSTTFPLTAPGGVSVSGVVTYVAAGSVATFTPTAALAPTTAYTATITTGALDLEGNALARDPLDLHHRCRPDCRTADGYFGDPSQCSHGSASQSDRERHFQHGDEPCHDQFLNLYADRARHNHRPRPGCLRSDWKHADIHADGESSAQHFVHSDDHNRGQKPGRCCNGQQLYLDVYHRNNDRVDRSGDRFDGPCELGYRRASESGSECSLY